MRHTTASRGFFASALIFTGVRFVELLAARADRDVDVLLSAAPQLQQRCIDTLRDLAHGLVVLGEAFDGNVGHGVTFCY